MTTTISGTTATFYINNPGIIAGTFSLKSQYSQEAVLSGNAYTITTQNARYAQVDVDVPATFADNHANGFYTVNIGDYSAIVKIITQPGGDLGESEYISNNENREADVFYRPNY